MKQEVSTEMWPMETSIAIDSWIIQVSSIDSYIRQIFMKPQSTLEIIW